MQTASLPLRRIAGLVATGVALAFFAPGVVRADGTDQADAFPTYESYIKLSGYAPWISGDAAAFAARSGSPTAGAFGIEDFFYTKDTSDTTTIKVNGKAMTGSDDYLASFNVTKANVGSFDVGYKSFRTFYDGVGGFFPQTDLFEKNSPENLHVDRSTFWASATLARPDQPVFNISFHDDIRMGQKDSTEWAAIISPLAVVVKGALVGTALPANTPFIAPNVLTVDEHHRIVDGSMVATIGKTTETVKLTFDSVNNMDSRNYMKYPGSKVIADPTVMVQDDQESRRSSSFRILNQTDTQFNKYVALDVGLTYSHLSSVNGGNWITPTYSSTANAVYTADTAANIYGGSKVDDYVGNAFLKLTPTNDWLADFGIRDESNTVSSSGGFMTTTLASGSKTIAVKNITTANDLTYSHYTDHIETPEVTLQYLGLPRVCLYGTFDDQIDRGNQHWVNPYAVTTTTGTGVVTAGTVPIGSVFFQEADQDYENLKVGANWNASNILTIRAEVYRKDHQNRFIGANDIIGTASYGGLYVTGYTFIGVKLSVIVKPLPQLSFSTRYQPQSGDMSVTANVANGGTGSEITSGKARGQQLSETVDWTPSGRFYAQGNLNVVYSYLQTAYPVVVESALTNIATPIQNANNNYVTGSALFGFVVDKLTDAQIQGTWQRANNYNPQIALGGQPYGSSYEQESVTVGLKHKFNNRLMAEGKVGYLQLTDPTTGGFTNYHGPLAYVSLTYSL